MLWFLFCLLSVYHTEVIHIKNLEPEARSTPEYPAITSYEMDLTLSEVELHLIRDIEGSARFSWERNANLIKTSRGTLVMLFVCDLVSFKYTQWLLQAEKLTSSSDCSCSPSPPSLKAPRVTGRIGPWGPLLASALLQIQRWSVSL